MKQSRALHLDRSRSSYLVSTMIGAMVFLATISVVGGLAVESAVNKWSYSLEDTLTIQVPETVEPNKAESQKHIAMIVMALTKNSKIKEAIPLPKEKARALLNPWLGKNILPPGIAIPTLIDVTLIHGVTLDTDKLQQNLRTLVPGTIVSNNEAFMDDTIHLARLLQMIAIIIILIVVFAGVAITVLSARAGIAMHSEAIELLHLIGASDSYIGREFVRQALKFSIFGGIVGFSIALVTVSAGGFIYYGSLTKLLPELELKLLQWSMLFCLPLAATLIAGITAHFTVIKSLRKLP